MASVAPTSHLSGLIGMAKSLQHPAHDPATAAMYKRLPGRRRHATPVTARPRRKALLQSRGCARNIAECFSACVTFFSEPAEPAEPDGVYVCAPVGRHVRHVRHVPGSENSHSRRRSAQTSQEVYGQRGFERVRMWLESVQVGRGREAQRAWRQHRCSARRPDRRVERPLPRRRPLVFPRVSLLIT